MEEDPPQDQAPIQAHTQAQAQWTQVPAQGQEMGGQLEKIHTVARGGARSGSQAAKPASVGSAQPSPMNLSVPGQRTSGGSRAQTWEDITYVEQGRYVQS